MSPIFYAINIATLATWLSVAGFGTVGIVIPTATAIFTELAREEDPYSDLDLTVLTEDFSLGEENIATETAAGSSGAADEPVSPATEEELLPTPPEMPEVAAFAPLPEIPDIPKPAVAPKDLASTPKPIPRNSTRSGTPTNPSSGSSRGRSDRGGTPGNGGTGGGSGMSDAQRLAGGRMPGPAYPAEARARGQSGTVVVEFIVGENGSVTSAYAKKPSPWPILNERAVSCVRRWRFPPGKVARYSRPIVFKLN